MTEASEMIMAWIAAGEPSGWILAGVLLAACFVIFMPCAYIRQNASC
jgi:hypothetical protein